MFELLPLILRLGFIFFIALLFISIPTSIAGLEISNFCLLILLVFSQIYLWFRHKQKIFFTLKWDLFLWLFWVWIVLASYSLDLPAEQIKSTIIAGRFVVSFYVMAFTFHLIGIKRIKKYTFLFQLHVLWISVFTIMQSYNGLYLKNWHWIELPINNLFRVRGFFNNTMTYSYVFGILFCYFLAQLIFEKNNKWKKIVNLFTLFCVGSSLILTYTRGMWLAIVFTSIIISFLVESVKVKKIIYASLIIVVAIFLALPNLRSRVISIADSNNISNSTRVELWKINLEISRENLFWGTGFSNKNLTLTNFYQENIGYLNYVGHAHNNFIEILASTGIIGLILYLIIFFLPIFYLFRIIRNWKDKKGSNSFYIISFCSLSGQLMFHLGGVTECTFLDYEVLYAMTTVMSLGFYVTFLNLKNELSI